MDTAPLLRDPRVRDLLAAMGHPTEGAATATASMLTYVEETLQSDSLERRQRAERIVSAAWDMVRPCGARDYRVTAVLGAHTHTMLVGRDVADSRDAAMREARRWVVTELGEKWRAARYEIEEV